MSIDLTQFFQTFFDEATDHLADMERLLLHIDVNAPVADDLDSVFRAAHSIKGGAGIFGFTKLTELTHILESHLDLVRAGKAKMTESISDEYLHAVDYLRDVLQCCRESRDPEPIQFASMLERFSRIGAAENHAAGVVPEFDKVPAAQSAPDSDPEGAFGFFEPPVSEEVAAGFGLFEPMESVSVAEIGDDSFGLFEPAPMANSVATDAVVVSATVHALPVQTPNSSPAASAAAIATKASADAASIRVSVERVDQLINLVGELVITQAMLAESGQHVQGEYAERLQHSLSLLERNTRDLQESVMSIRMLPISSVFNRFPRVVRDLSQKLNKQVELVIFGEGTELDRGLIEKLVDPLTHLVRNSIDHGIESPDTRLAAGKSARGTVHLRASQQGGNIVVEVSDDGAGLNRERILAKAHENGLPVHDGMTDAEVWLLIFAPGFSTAAEVTDVSGRGVGMDVVKRNITDLGGRVEITSNPGKGSNFIIRLPLTLAILDGMSVAVGKETFIVPITFILESLQPRAEDIKRVAGQGEVILVRGDYLPMINLSQLLGIPPNPEATNNILLLVQSGGDKAALRVDALLGQHQVVIKSLEVNYRRVAGVSGATVMGDGRVALILDVADLVRQHAMAAAA